MSGAHKLVQARKMTNSKTKESRSQSIGKDIQKKKLQKHNKTASTEQTRHTSRQNMKAQRTTTKKQKRHCNLGTT